MTSPNTNNIFLSQRIEAQCGAPPLLLHDNTNINNKHSTPKPCQHENDQKAISWDMNIQVSLIPTLPIYYVLEPASITLRGIPVRVVESRLADFLRIHSICYTYHSDTVRIECTTSNLLKFVIQFWRVGGTDDADIAVDPDRAVTLELQRRQGSVIEMQVIRRKMFQAVQTGEQMKAPMDLGRLSMQGPAIPDTIMAEVEAKSHYDHDAGRKDALEICLRLLESNCIDQSGLGLESLRMLTDPSVVSHQDALIVSRAVLFREGDFGARFQTELARYSFGMAAAVAGRSAMAEYHYNQAYSQFESFHNLGLAILANALQLVEYEKNASKNKENISIDLTDSFWELILEDLLYNVERAVQNPNEGAVSAKCIRFLQSLSFSNSIQSMATAATHRARGLRTCLAQAHQFGKGYHWMLEQESQKLLDMDVDTFLLAH